MGKEVCAQKAVQEYILILGVHSNSCLRAHICMVKVARQITETASFASLIFQFEEWPNRHCCISCLSSLLLQTSRASANCCVAVLWLVVCQVCWGMGECGGYGGDEGGAGGWLACGEGVSCDPMKEW